MRKELTSFQVPPQVTVVSDAKAYMVDYRTRRGFTWNPSTMDVINIKNLSQQLNNVQKGVTYQIFAEASMQRIGNKLVSAYHYRDPATLKSLNRSGVLIIDMDKDEFSTVEHPECRAFSNSIVGADGYVYVASGHWAAAEYFTESGASPCLARLDSKIGVFDINYGVDLSNLVGKPAGSMVESTGKGVYV